MCRWIRGKIEGSSSFTYTTTQTTN
uniref:Uncharacterized protein n=1 Tax=Anguilla anguilla TaxID=7936 RepID=A0A0E9VCB0_ANGAN